MNIFCLSKKSAHVNSIISKAFVVLCAILLSAGGCTEDDTKADGVDGTVGLGGYEGVGCRMWGGGLTWRRSPMWRSLTPFPADCVAEVLEVDFTPSPLSGAIVDPGQGRS